MTQMIILTASIFGLFIAVLSAWLIRGLWKAMVVAFGVTFLITLAALISLAHQLASVYHVTLLIISGISGGVVLLFKRRS